MWETRIDKLVPNIRVLGSWAKLWRERDGWGISTDYMILYDEIWFR